MKDALRRLAQRTAHRPLVAAAYRGYYAAALAAATVAIGRSPGVETVFANRSIADGGWVPGYSDIDLVVVIEERTPDEDLARQQRIWTRVAALRRVFPMLGTIHLVTAAELRLWLVWGGPRRIEYPRWKRLRGKPVAE